MRTFCFARITPGGRSWLLRVEFVPTRRKTSSTCRFVLLRMAVIRSRAQAVMSRVIIAAAHTATPEPVGREGIAMLRCL